MKQIIQWDYKLPEYDFKKITDGSKQEQPCQAARGKNTFNL